MPEAVVSIAHAAAVFCHDGALAGGGRRTGVATALARATLDDSLVIQLLLAVCPLSTLLLYSYGH
jgi:hypothetical protein